MSGYVGHLDVRRPVRVDPTRPPLHTGAGRVAPPAGAAAFDSALAEALTGLRVSGHARERLLARGIALDAAEAQRLRAAVERLSGKGAREAVVLLDDRAYVVSVANRTLITALDGASIREHVFTGIDAAALG